MREPKSDEETLFQTDKDINEYLQMVLTTVA